MKTPKLSRLELYMEILKILDTLRSSNLISIQQKTNIDNAFLKHAMTFLEKQNLIDKENVENEVVYRPTARGERVTRFFTGKSQDAVIEEHSFAVPDDATCA